MRYVVTIFIIFIFVFLGFLLFGHHSGKPASNPVVAKALADYASTDVDVRLTVDGQVNGDDAHRQIVLTVGRDKRTLQVIQGYQGHVLKQESFNNNQPAYSAFLHSLDVNGFALTRKAKKNITDEQGQCALGQRFIYEVIDNGKDNLRTWSTSCNGSSTFGGQPVPVQQLFQNQITNYGDYVGDVNL